MLQSEFKSCSQLELLADCIYNSCLQSVLQSEFKSYCQFEHLVVVYRMSCLPSALQSEFRSCSQLEHLVGCVFNVMSAVCAAVKSSSLGLSLNI